MVSSGLNSTAAWNWVWTKRTPKETLSGLKRGKRGPQGMSKWRKNFYVVVSSHPRLSGNPIIVAVMARQKPKTLREGNPLWGSCGPKIISKNPYLFFLTFSSCQLATEVDSCRKYMVEWENESPALQQKDQEWENPWKLEVSRRMQRGESSRKMIPYSCFMNSWIYPQIVHGGSDPNRILNSLRHKLWVEHFTGPRLATEWSHYPNTTENTLSTEWQKTAPDGC